MGVPRPARMSRREASKGSKSKKGPLRSPIFAPLNTPVHRRLQTLAVLTHLFSIPFFLSLLWVLGFVALYHPNSFLGKTIQIFMVIYFVYYVYDFKRPFRGNAKPSKWFVRFLSPWFKCYREYFPVRIVLEPAAEAALDKLKRNPRPLLFGSHPHGIVSIGTVTNFILDPEWLSERFPHVDVRLLTLNMNMIWPFWRDWLLALGFASVDRLSCENILSKSGEKGESRGFTIVVGGAKEALDAAPGRMDLTLNSRNGFFRLALKHGALLFPVISFGENDIYDQMEFAPIRMIQRAWHKIFGFSTPFFFGRGVFNYKFGWLPRRVPITTVIGKPIDVGVSGNDSVTETEVRELRDHYIVALTELYESNKTKYEVVSCPKGLRILH